MPQKRTIPEKDSPTATEAKATQMVRRLEDRYRIGQKAKYTRLSIARFAAKEGLSTHTVRKLKRFANTYSPEDLKELCRLRRPNGLPLHFGYVNFLLVVADKAERVKFQQRLAHEGWSAAELSTRIPGKFRGPSPHGRPMMKPASTADGLRQVAEEADRLRRRTKLVVDAVKRRPRKRAGRALRKRAETTAKAVASLKRQLTDLERQLRGMAEE